MIERTAWTKQGTVAAVALGVYALLLTPVFFSWAFVPDEVWFQRDAREIAAAAGEAGWLNLWLQQPPHLGYGALFWWSYALLLDSLPFWAGLWTARVIVWLCLVSIPFALLQVSRQRWPVLLLWLSLPTAWWTGKLNAPEIPVLTLCAWAFVLVLRPGIGGAGGAGLLAGVAIGLKATALAVLPALALLGLFARRDMLRSTRLIDHGVATAASLALGFTLANPLVLAQPEAVFAQIAGAGTPLSLSATTLERFLWAPYHEWDVVPSGGIFAHVISLAALCLLAAAIVVALRNQRQTWLLCLATIATAVIVVLLFSRERFLAWYVFPALVALLFVVGQLPRTRLVTGLLLAAVAGQLLSQGPHVVQSVRLKLDHAERLARIDDMRAPLREVLADLPPADLVVDLSETAVELAPASAEAGLQATGKIYRDHDAQHLLALGLGAAAPASARSAILVVGDRVHMSGFYSVETYRAADWLGDWRFVETRVTEGATLYRFTRSAGGPEQEQDQKPESPTEPIAGR